jgi:hypothetical protein
MARLAWGMALFMAVKLAGLVVIIAIAKGWWS